MNRARLLKSTLCIAATVTIMMSAKPPVSQAIEISAETGIAGISLSLDKYYTVAVESDVDVLATTLPAATTPTPTPVATVAPTPTPEPVSEYANTGISIAGNYVNIRTKASEDSEVTGKLYKGCAATITETKGDWVKIKSGSVEGYIKKEFLAIGFSAEELVDKYGTKLATVATTTLKVREKKSTDSTILTLVPEGEVYEALSVDDKWVKILVDEDITGYISKEYVNISVEFKEAVSVEEEKAKLAQEEAARLAEEQAAKDLADAQAAKKAAAKKAAAQKKTAKKTTTKAETKTKTETKAETTTKSEVTEPSTSGSSTGEKVAAFALNYVGNPYVYGGTSLTHGTDCSGFVMSVYSHFGYSLSRSSDQQAGNGTKVSLDALQPGDLVFYSSGGGINHVALYIGGGKVVHASTRVTGIKVSGMYYRTPACARRIIN